MKRIGWAALAVVWLAAGSARAYLIDLNDARVTDPGRMEIEFQPAGYYMTLLGEEERYLIAPSMQWSIGLATDWDLLHLTRGYVRLDDADEPPYSIQEHFVAVRRMLVNGAYNDDELEGPSLALQIGVYIPGALGPDNFGSSVAILFGWGTDAGSFHANVWLTYTQYETIDVFSTVMYEGPPDWPLRPTAELYLDVDDGQPYASGLVGALLDITDDFLLQAGVRVGGWEDYADLEIRLSSFIGWDPAPGSRASDPGDEARARPAPPTLARARLAMRR
ncbi:MAG: hypothetical protein KF729_12780 [Sandaracinaceae bacterium]|nr:hypothetical protein [Sandaracinaceae bacterium]